MNAVKTLSLTRSDPQRRSNLQRRHLTQKVAFGVLWLFGLVAILALVGITLFVFIQTGSYLWTTAEFTAEVGTLPGAVRAMWAFLTLPPRGGLQARGGMSTTIVTTLYLVGLTLAIATPLGVGAGIYLVEYAGEMMGSSGWQARLIAIIRFGVETLAGIPSIIFGLFGYLLFVSMLGFGFSMLAAALSGACLVLPVIIRTTEEALLTVPRDYREGSLALGATRWQTIWKVVLPAALPGIITGLVLSMGRIISETAVFYVTLGGSYHMPPSPLREPLRFLTSGGRTMALHLYYLANDTAAFDKAMVTGAVLIVCIVLTNAAINYLSRRLNRRLRGTT